MANVTTTVTVAVHAFTLCVVHWQIEVIVFLVQLTQEPE
jgi:hypothetical protein